MIVVLLGPPGCGKGTQAKRLWGERKLPQLSTGDMLRAAIQGGLSVGKEAKAIMDQGLLVPDSLVVRLIEERSKGSDCREGFVLDGFPRNIAQAEALDEMLTHQGREVGRVLFFDILDELLVKRLSGRRTCLKCGALYHVESTRPKKDGICDHCGQVLVHRDDDTPKVIEKRQVIYHQQTEPLIDFYRKQKKLRTINAAQGTESVGLDVAAALKQE